MPVFAILIAVTGLVLVGVLANHYGRDSREWLNQPFPGFLERPR